MGLMKIVTLKGVYLVDKVEYEKIFYEHAPKAIDDWRIVGFFQGKLRCYFLATHEEWEKARNDLATNGVYRADLDY